MEFNNYLLKLESGINKKEKENICLHGISFIIKSIYLDIKNKYKRKIIKTLHKEINSPYQTIYSWISRSNPIPISRAYKLLKFWKENYNKSEEEFNSKWDLIYRKTIGFSQNGQRKVSLPKRLNKNLAYIVGFFQGDGYLCKEKTGFQEYSIHFYESNKKVLDSINQILYTQFGIYGKIYFQSNETGKWYSLRVCSKPIYLFLKKVLKLKSGKKVRNVSVPKIIKNSNSDIQLSFIRGFFDAEGGVGEAKKNPWLEMGQASKDIPCEILIWIRKKLHENGIIMSKPYRSQKQEFFRIRTAKRETIKRFFEVISSNHPKKIIKFNEIINR